MGGGERGLEPGGDHALAAPDAPAEASPEPLPEPESSPEPAGSEVTAQAPGEPVGGPTFEASPLRLAHRRVRRAADLRQQLDEKAAATDELREALHELRQVLDVDSAPPPASHRSRRIWLIAGTAGLAIAVALVGWLLTDNSSGGIVASRPSAPGVSTSGASSTGAPSTSAAGAGRASVPAPTIRRLPWPGGPVLTPPGLSTAGPGASVPGTDVQVAIDPDGRHLDVFERLLLAAPSGDPLSLAAPSRPALYAAVRVSDLQVQLDDAAVAVVADGTGSWHATPAAGRPYTHVTLRYRLTGALVTVRPAAPGRAFGIVAPLTGAISAGPGNAVRVRAGGDGVVGVSCPTVRVGEVCGTRDADGWTATVPQDARPIVVLLQLDTNR